MSSRLANSLKIAGLVAVLLVVVLASAAAVRKLKGQKEDPDSAGRGATSVEAAGPAALRFTRLEVVQTLGIQVVKAEKAMKPDRQAEKHGRQLVLRGTLGPDTDRYVQIRPRFTGEVVQIGTIRDGGPGQPTQSRRITNGDPVSGPKDNEQGTLLAVVSSKDLGQLKSNLLTALSQLALDEKTLERQIDGNKQGVITDQQVRESSQKVENDRVNADAARRTLRFYRLTDQEMNDLEKELAGIMKRGAKSPTSEEWKNWARVEVRAPQDGTILESNINIGALVDNSTSSTPLFIVGDLSRLSVWANLYEEDIPALLALPKPIPWTVHLLADPKAKPIKGFIHEIRPIVDPSVHAVLIKAYVDNPEGKLLAGQFITATVNLPALPNEVVVPTSALVEDGSESVIFVQPNPTEPVYEMRHVQVLRRGKDRDGNDVVHLRWVWPEALTFLSAWPIQSNPVTLMLQGFFQGSQNNRFNPLRDYVKPEEEWVVTSGAILLRAAMNDLQESKAVSSQ
jgi:cobalt-zinc-cadmium efflux system membrane fusion protein